MGNSITASEEGEKDVPPDVVFKYTSIKAARSILAHRKLRFHSPLAFNDPFDAQWNPMWQLDTPTTKKAIESLFIEAVSRPSCWPTGLAEDYRQMYQRTRNDWMAQHPRDRQRWLEDQARVFANPSDTEDLARRLLLQHAELRVACFSAKSDSILMWSHYAEQHRGVVLGFRPKAFPAHPFGPLKKVRYLKHLPEICSAHDHAASVVYGIDPNYSRDEAEKVVLGKYEDWEYEQEWRFVLRTTPEDRGEWEDLEFPAEGLVSVSLGVRTDTAQARELFALALRINRDAKLHAFGVHPHMFALVELPEPWKAVFA